jgi:putative NIF3 family GTP cyclohydrolase 1 type 2
MHFLAIVLASACSMQAADTLTARQIVERIKAETGIQWSENTVDTFKAGNPDTAVTGIATTHIATLDVLQRAAAGGKNFVISHEPTFYNHRDETDQFGGDPVYKAKQAFIREHNMVVFRFHDHWHRRRPDGIVEGTTDKLGWREYRLSGGRMQFQIPEVTLGHLARYLKIRFPDSIPRVVGDLDMKVTNIAMSPGAGGSAGHIRTLEQDGVEVLIVGEVPEWETVEYAQDAHAAGHRKALILLGHAPSEEAGMELCAEWLRGFLPKIPVEFVPAGDPFWTP